MEEARQSCILKNLPCLLLQEPHLENRGQKVHVRCWVVWHLLEPFAPMLLPEPQLNQGSESTCRRLDSLVSSRPFRACSCRNRTWNRGQRVHARCRTVLHLLKPSVLAPAETAPETGVREYRVHAGCWTILHLLKTSVSDPTGTAPGTEVREYKQEGWTILHLLKPSVPYPGGTTPGTGVREYKQDAGQSCIFKTVRACSCRNRFWNRGQRVHSEVCTVLHLQEPSVPAPARTVPGTGVKEHTQDAGHSCIFQNLPCLLLQEPHLEQGSESTCRRLDNLASS
jgi:hypothetical protein